MSPRPRSRPLAGIIEPCLPRPADRPPIGGNWLHEIKHDGFRIMARRDAAGVRLLTRNGHDFAGRFPIAAAAVAALPARSCLIDGEAIVTDRNGLAVFDLIRGHRPSAAVLCAFDLLELDGRGFASRADRNPQEHPEVATARQACGHRVQRALHSGWRNRLPSGLRAWLRGHRVEALRLAVSLQALGLLVEGQEQPKRPGGHAGGRGGVELTWQA
jgi:hypothetical protein